MDFTEKKFAHLPARESHFKEPPYPKSKNIEKKPNDVFIDIEDKDPLWLKDKGDHFYKRCDFYSAINAYSKSLENEKDFLMARLNRGTCFLKMRIYQGCIDECDKIEEMIKALPEKERIEDDVFYAKIQGRVYLKRGAAYAWLSQYEAAIYDYEKAMNFKGIYNEE
jgi:dyslexia susceptibility 1 candidate gene 1 protein